MKITTDHPASAYGVPIILDAKGSPMDYAPGVRKIRDKLGLTQAQFAERLGLSRRTVEGWECGDQPPGRKSLYEMAKLIQGNS